MITLPPTSVRLPSLHVLNPVTLKGVPGSLLEIYDGSIVVDFSGQSKETVAGDSPKPSCFVSALCSSLTEPTTRRSS